MYLPDAHRRTRCHKSPATISRPVRWLSLGHCSDNGSDSPLDDAGVYECQQREADQHEGGEAEPEDRELETGTAREQEVVHARRRAGDGQVRDDQVRPGVVRQFWSRASQPDRWARESRHDGATHQWGPSTTTGFPLGWERHRIKTLPRFSPTHKH